MTLRVALDARALDLPYLREQGIGRYTAGLLDALGPLSRERGGELVVMRTGGALSPFASDGAGPAGEAWRMWRPPLPEWLAMACEQPLLRWDLHRARAQVLHSSSIYRAVPAPGRPSVVALHDVIPLQFPDDYLRTGMRYRLMYAAARRADLLLTVSQQARRDIVAHLEVPPESVVVVPGAAHPRFRPTPRHKDLLAQLGITKPYVLYVGGLAERDPRKGVDELIDAFAAWTTAEERPETLVLAGHLGAAAGAVQERARRSGARIVFTGFVPDEQLPALYSAATCLVTCSRYEGFGLPALEALACGTPVAAYRVGAHEEVAGPGALLVDEGKPDALMLAVQVVADHAEVRARLAGAGRDHAARFTWHRSAELTWDAYEHVADRGQAGLP